MGQYRPEEGNFEVNASRIAVIVARWNSEVTDGLLEGAVRALGRHGISGEAECKNTQPAQTQPKQA